MVDKVCEAIATGQSVNELSKTNNFPDHSTIYKWLAKYPDFAEKYERAREKQAEIYANQIIDIADNCRPDSDSAAKAKLQVEARKWIIAKLLPKKYGDKVTLQGDKDNPIQISLAAALDQRIAAARAAPVIEHEPNRESLAVIDVEAE